jgi:hypothetical protein
MLVGFSQVLPAEDDSHDVDVGFELVVESGIRLAMVIEPIPALWFS